MKKLIKDFIEAYKHLSPQEDKEELLSLAERWEPFWNIENGRTLCKKCHTKTDTYGRKSRWEKQPLSLV